MDKPEALRLADALMETHPYPLDIKQAAAELRLLYADNFSLIVVNKAFAERQKWWNERMLALEQQRDALLKALLRIESAVDWYLGRSSFTQTTQLKGLEHSANVRKELFAAHDEARAAIKAVEGEQK